MKEIYLCNGFGYDVFPILSEKHLDENLMAANLELAQKVRVGNVASVSLEESYELAMGDSENPDFTEWMPVSDGFLSLYYQNGHGQNVCLHLNTLRNLDKTYILTLSGDLLESSLDNHWTSKDGVSHKPLACDDCERSLSISGSLDSCPSCFYVTNVSTLQSAMCQIMDESVATHLAKLAKDIYFDPAEKGFEKAKEIQDKLRQKAQKYMVIESEAKRFVAMTKEYGLRVEEAHQDYLEDKDFDAFVSEVEDTKDLRKKFEEVTNKHCEIIGEVGHLKDEAESGSNDMKCRASIAEKQNLEGLATTVAGSSSVGVGGAAAASLVRFGTKNVATFEMVAARIGMGGVAIGVVGGVALLGLLGSAGYLAYKRFTAEASFNFHLLASKFDKLAIGIGNIERHLKLVEECLRNIETKWRGIINESGEMIGKARLGHGDSNYNVDKELRLVEKVTKKVGELKNSCIKFEERTNSTSIMAIGC